MIDIRQEILNAKLTNRAYFHKAFWLNVPSWQDFLNCIFKEIESDQKITLNGGGSQIEKSIGNVVITNDIYFSPQVRDLKYFKSMESFIQEFMNVNKIPIGVSGPKISIGPKIVEAHSDQWDAFSLQCQGTSIWTISYRKDKYKETFYMEPGDLLFFPKDTMHSLDCKEPRAGIIFSSEDVNNILINN